MAKEMENFSKYERARILGARALQISMDAPLLMKVDKEDLENLNYDPLKMAQKELDSGVLPITVNRPMPEKVDEKLKQIKIEELEKDEDEKGEDNEEKAAEAEEQVEVIKEEVKQEVAEMKPDDELEEEIEEEGGDSIGGEEDSSYDE